MRIDPMGSRYVLHDESHVVHRPEQGKVNINLACTIGS